MRSRLSFRSPLALAALGLVACLAVWVGVAAAVPGTPAAITAAIQRFEPKANDVVTSEAAFDKFLQTVPAMRLACAQPYARPQLAKVFGIEAATFLQTTHAAEQGEVPLYALSRLLPNHASKARYTALLDKVGTLFDKLLAVGNDMKKIGANVSAGNCGDAIVSARADASILPQDIARLNGALAQLLAAYVD